MTDKVTTVKIYTNQRSPHLFKSKFLEFLTKSHPAVIDIMYGIIAFFLMRFYFNHYGAGNPTGNGDGIAAISLQFLYGFLSWSLAEYLMHRFLYHKPSDATYDDGIQYLFHGIHHYFPDDTSRTVLPPVPSLGIASLFFGLFWLVIGKYAFTYGAGFMMGYCAYMTVHYILHKVPPPKGFSWWWNFHNIHHYQQHDRAFGVTSPIWDYVFHTMPEEGRRTVIIEVAKPGEEFVKKHMKDAPQEENTPEKK